MFFSSCCKGERGVVDKLEECVDVGNEELLDDGRIFSELLEEGLFVTLCALVHTNDLSEIKKQVDKEKACACEKGILSKKKEEA